MKKILTILALITMLATPIAAVVADTTDSPVMLKETDALSAAKTITSGYTDWHQVTLAGKLHIDRLPISPSIKMYMERASLIVISMRVPLLGEVGTLEITPEHALMVNKMKRTYCDLSLSEFMSDLPVTLSDLQDIFLARIFLPQAGTLSMTNYTQADFYSDPGGGWLILPRHQPVEYDVSCGYSALTDGRTSNIFVSTLDGADQAVAAYDYDGKKTDVSLTLRYKNKDHTFGLTIHETDWKGKALKGATPDAQYRSQTLREFLKSL